MKRPLLLLIVLGYIAVAVYSVGKTGGGSKASLTSSMMPKLASLNRVTLATKNMAAMVQFYNKVFGAELVPVPQDGANTAAFHQGNLAGIDLVLCSNETARVKATQNRQQLRFLVADLEATMQLVKSAGGKIIGKVNERHDEKVATVHDPDGNSLEFTQSIK